MAFAAVALAQNISIGTGGTGGVYYPMGGGLAAVLSKYVPGMQATAEVTGGSVDNLKLIGTDKPYVGFTMADAGLDAYKGEDKFKGNKIPVRTLMVLYPEPDACGVGRRPRHQQAGRPQGQAHLHRLARQRHRSDGVPDSRGRRHRQGQGRQARAARRCRIRECDEGQQDRGLLLGRRPADRGRHRPGQHARHQDQDDRSFRGRAPR